jgi:hypothetical protein
MDYLRRLLSRSRRRPAALLSSILNRVPLEILVYMMDFLPKSAVASSLSCMQLKCLLGTQHFLKVASSAKNTLALLGLLALDLPNQVVIWKTCLGTTAWPMVLAVGFINTTLYASRPVWLRTGITILTRSPADLVQLLSRWPSRDITNGPSVQNYWRLCPEKQ